MGNLHDFTTGAVVWNKAYAFPKPLTEEQLRHAAPSIFAEHAAETVSGRYLFMPTFEILRRIQRETNLVPVRAREIRVRDEGNRLFAKHEITLRASEPDREWRVGDCLFESRLTNSHNLASAYALDAGLFRFACSNALLVSDAALPGIRVRHSGDESFLARIIEGTCELVREGPQLQHRIADMRSTTLDPIEQVALAKAAAVLRWDEGKEVIPAPRLLEARRNEDVGMDAWRVMNRVQENLITGGQRAMKRNAQNKVRKVRSRAVGSISEDQRINKALWTLTEELMRMKNAA